MRHINNLPRSLVVAYGDHLPSEVFIGSPHPTKFMNSQALGKMGLVGLYLDYEVPESVLEDFYRVAFARRTKRREGAAA